MLQPMTPVSPICKVTCDGFVVGIPGWLLRVRDALHDQCACKPSLQQLAELG